MLVQDCVKMFQYIEISLKNEDGDAVRLNDWIVVLRRSSTLTLGSTDGRYVPEIQAKILSSEYDELAGRPAQRIDMTRVTRGECQIINRLLISESGVPLQLNMGYATIKVKHTCLVVVR